MTVKPGADARTTNRARRPRKEAVAMAAEKKARSSSPRKKGTAVEPAVSPLKERWERLRARDAAHQAEGERLGDERWAIAKELFDRHEAGETMAALGRELGTSDRTVSSWIEVHRHFRRALAEDLALLAFDPDDNESRAPLRGTWRSSSSPDPIPF
jgi:hypothetical protein